MVFDSEPPTCHSGHWCPINENSAGGLWPSPPLLKRLWREVGAITLPPWVFFTEEDSYCHNIPASSHSAPRHGEKWFDLPVAGSLAEGKFQLLKRAAFRNYAMHFRRQRLLKRNIKAKRIFFFSKIVPS